MVERPGVFTPSDNSALQTRSSVELDACVMPDVVSIGIITVKRRGKGRVLITKLSIRVCYGGAISPTIEWGQVAR